MNDVEKRLSKILVRHFGVDEDKITPDTDFRYDLAADSLDLIDLRISVENAFGIEIADATAAELHTVGDLIAFIRGQRAGLSFYSGAAGRAAHHLVSLWRRQQL